MIIWLRRHTPTWLLRYLGWRNYRLRMAGRLPDYWYWADLELCLRERQVCDKCGHLLLLADRCWDCDPPVGVPEWLGEEHKPYHVVGANENEDAITVWIYPPEDIISQIGEKILCNGIIHIVTESGLVPYMGESHD